MVRQLTRRTLQLAPLTVLFGLTVLAFWYFWRETGTRALLVLATGILLGLLIDAVWGFVTLRHPVIEATVPADATVGEPMPIAVCVNGVRAPVQLHVLSMPGTPPVRLDAPDAGTVEAVPLVSGRFPWAIFEIAVRGPLGLVGWTRRAVVELPSAVHIAPRAIPHELEFPAFPGGRAGQTRGSRTQADLVRSVRDYVPGDPSRLIHWGATARTGQLMVKELDPAGAGDLTVVLDLHADTGPAPVRADRSGAGRPTAGPSRESTSLLGADAAAGRARHLVERALQDGWRVRLITRESVDESEHLMPRLRGNRLPIRIVKRPAAETATVSRTVAGPTDGARRLACADFGAPEVEHRSSGLVRVVSSNGVDRWL